VYGFAKSAQANLDEDQLRALKELAGEMLRYDGAALARAAKSGAIQEVRCIEEEGRM